MILLYFILILLIGFYTSKPKTSHDFLFCSRKITLPSFVATLVTTWYGGILEIGRFTFENGIVTWIIFGVFYYIAAMVYACFIGPKLYKNNIKTIPQYFKHYYGRVPQIISALIIILVSSPAPYIMILSMILMHIYDINYYYSLLIGIFFSLSYVYVGGFKSIIRTDKLQFTLMFSGFILMLYYLVSNYGGLSFIYQNTPKDNLKIMGNLPIGYIISWSFISLITLIDPNIFQRSFSSKDILTAKNGMLISIIFWFIFDFLAISTGLYASAILDTTTLQNNPYLALADMLLPSFVKSIFYLSLISIVMSTIDSFSFVSAITISEDLFHHNTTSIKRTQFALIITALLSFIIAAFFTYVIDIWYIFGTISVVSILCPFLLMIFKKEKINRIPIFSIVFPLLITLIWMFYKNPYGIDSIYPGLLSSMLINYLALDNK